MYLAIVILLMGAAPATSVAVETEAAGGAFWPLVLKWFLFWGAGIRLLLAGVSQTLRPGFTAQKIFHIQDAEAAKIVVELGFANLAMGAVAALSLALPSWRLPAAVCAALFLLLAGIQHLRNTQRSAKENAAMVSDLWLAAVLAAAIAATET